METARKHQQRFQGIFSCTRKGVRAEEKGCSGAV